MRYEDVIGQFAGRQAGSPAPSPTPGGSPVTSTPGPQGPPGLNSAMPGRKPDNPAPNGLTTPPMAPPPFQVSEPQSDPVTEDGAADMESQKNVGGAAPVMMMNRMPTSSDLLDIPPGVTVRTPYGDLDQEGNIVKTPEYEQKHKEAIVRARQKFGPHPWAGMAGVPEPTIELGKGHFNPFTNQFGRAE